MEVELEVEWAKFTRFFLRDRAVFQKSATFNIVYVDAHFKGENDVVFEIRC